MKLRFLILLCLLSSATWAEPNIAIIIDDVGYKKQESEAALALHPKLTYAIIPHSTYGRAMATQAADKHREVIIHMPMASKGFGKLDKGGLTLEDGGADIQRKVDEAFQIIPNAVGMNNHMGSAVTEDSLAMHYVMNTLAQHNAFFIDSRTTTASKAIRLARFNGVPHASRKVFLDNEADEAAIHQQFKKLLNFADEEGSAIAIGHPYPETIEYLEKALPLLEKADVELVPASQLISFQ